MTYWKDSLLVGVPQIDEQHRKLVGAVDRLMDACKQGKGRSAIKETLEFTLSYTKEHFRDEEVLQAQHSYPEMIAHKRLHALFISNVTAILREFEQTGPSITMIGNLNKTLVDWLNDHISIEDKKLSAHILKQTA